MTVEKWHEAEKYLSENDPILAQVIKEYGPCTLASPVNYYQNLCESIISQQISIKVADAINNRFISLFPQGQVDPERVMELNEEELRSVGLSKQKVRYLKDLTAKVLSGEVTLETIDQLSNREIEKQLVKVKGIGPWTVTMFLIFCLNRTDILPVGDLGVKKAIQNLYNFEEIPTLEEMGEVARLWHPYETIASWYLWRSLENKN